VTQVQISDNRLAQSVGTRNDCSGRHWLGEELSEEPCRIVRRHISLYLDGIARSVHDLPERIAPR
jgi:hypothetical protein